MRNAIILSGLVGLAVAAPAPAPQVDGIDFDVVAAAGTPVVSGAPAIDTVASAVPTYNPTAAASSASVAAQETPIATDDSSAAAKKKRQATTTIAAAAATCTKLPVGSGPTTTPDTSDAFSKNPVYDSIALSASPPTGYSLSFSDLQGSSQQGGYLGYYTLSSYDTTACAHKCDAAAGCVAFNIYFERDPTVIPAAGCDNPPSTTNIKCSLYGLPVSASTATNNGQWQDNFHVVIAGSNGYNSIAPPPTQPGFTGPVKLGGSVVAPLINGKNTFIGSRMYAGPYDPSQCAAACLSTTSFDKVHLVASDGTYTPCNYFNSFVVSENNSPLGTYCQLYNQVIPSKYATNQGQYDGQGNYFSVAESYGYSLNPQDPGVISTPATATPIQ